MQPDVDLPIGTHLPKLSASISAYQTGISELAAVPLLRETPVLARGLEKPGARENILNNAPGDLKPLRHPPQYILKGKEAVYKLLGKL
jgi:hypothetical protein